MLSKRILCAWMVLWGNHLISSAFTSTNTLENFLNTGAWGLQCTNLDVLTNIDTVYLGFNEHRFVVVMCHRTSSTSQAGWILNYIKSFILFITLAISRLNMKNCHANEPFVGKILLWTTVPLCGTTNPLEYGC